MTNKQCSVMAECASVLHDLEILSAAVQFMQDLVRCGRSGVGSTQWHEGKKWLAGEAFRGTATGGFYIGVRADDLLQAMTKAEEEANLPDPPLPG